MSDDQQPKPNRTRRKFILGLTTAATVGLAGCGGGGNGGDGGGGDGNGGGTATETTTMTATETATETDTQTETPAGTANLRVAHTSPNAPNVDVAVDGSTALEDVAFGEVSTYLEVPAGERRVQISPADSDTAVFEGAVSVEADTDYTVAAIGEVGEMADQPFQPLVLEDDNSDPGDQARLRAVHVSPDAPAVDITASDGDTVLFDGVEYGQSGYITVSAGTYGVEIRGDTSGNDGDVVAEFDVELQSGQVYTAFAGGYLTPDDESAETAFDLIISQDTGMMGSG